MSKDELAVMDGNKCILRIRGVRSFYSDKFDITEHKRYKELAEYSDKNRFDLEKYLRHELVLKQDDEFDVYEVDPGEA